MSLAKYEQYAKKMDLFQGLNAEEIHKIFSRGRTVNCPKDSILFYEGATGNQMFIVLGGKIALHKNKKHLADLVTGDMFGEMALISSEPRSATATAAEDSLVFVLDETLFEKLLTKRIAIQLLMNVIRTLCKRLRISDAKLTT